MKTKATKTAPNPEQTIKSYIEELEDGSLVINVDYINSKKTCEKHGYIFLDSAEDLKIVSETANNYLCKNKL